MPRSPRPAPSWLDRPWPRAADSDAALRLLERFADLGPAEARIAAQPGGRGLLAALGGNSPYLADLALREPQTLRRIARAGPDLALSHSMALLARIPARAPRAQLAAALRRAKREIALIAAIADIGGLWTLSQVTAALSDLADAALSRATMHLLRAAHDAGELRLPYPADPARNSGLIVLGMGKLGARELNYSSDVDLILLYDPDAHPYHAATLGGVFTRLARNLVALMEARDGDGYVFRTDLRLRPDPAATPPAVALPAAFAYYESMGQNWERQALIKARPVAGDLALGLEFLAELRPFIWRRHLDFAAIADIHGMKRRIDDAKGGALPALGSPPARIAGRNIKLGQGGIREIEFAAQMLQLVWGGRDPALRQPTTLGALRRLVRAGHMPRRDAAELAAAYRFLRRAEHRLQMVADRQTHTLPSEPAELDRFAVFMSFADADAFARRLLPHLERVALHFAQVFEQAPDVPPNSLDFRAAEDPAPKTVAALRALGFGNVGSMVAAISGWRAGRVRAMRSDRARDLLDAVLPALLAALARQKEPDAAFLRFDRLLAQLPAGVQLLSMFQRNPVLIERIAAVLGAAPALADHLASVPSALEGLLAPGGPDPDPSTILRAQLRDARMLEDAVAITRRLVRAEDFALSVAQMEGRLDVDKAGLARTLLADAALSALLLRVMDDHAARYGAVPGGSMVVVALGKAGGREMMAGSDLDLMLIYDHALEVTESTGARKVPASQYFTRAAHAFVAALTSPGAEGPLFAVDMRLRPSGNKGPVAVSLAAFRRYHAEDAWTWERMALTRARVVTGPAPLRARVERAIAAALATQADPAQLRRDAADMRARMLRDLPPSGPWDVKHRPGGQIEVEFIAQVLQLLHGAEAGFDTSTRIALRLLTSAGVLAPPDAALLIHADHVWRTVQSLLRITVGHATSTLPRPAAETLLRDAGAGVDLTQFRATLDRLAEQVRAAFIRTIGDPGGTV